MLQQSLSKALSQREDVSLVSRYQAGDQEAFALVAAKYLWLVRLKACSFREVFALEQEDLHQEGLLGLLDACSSFCPEKGVSFETYAGRCIQNRIVSAVRRSNNLKNGPLNSAISIEEADRHVSDASSDPQALVEAQEEFARLFSGFSHALSPMEQNVLRAYLDGYRRSEIEEKFGISTKAFDNAMARVRNKFRKHP